MALYVGRVAPEKNIELAITAFRAMQRRNAATKLVIVGDGPLRTRLQQKHPDLNFEGLRRDEQLAACYASADVFLFPSETETFGNVVLEAMASGLAVVAYDYAAARMHVTSGETGMRVPYADADAFVAAAVRLAQDAGLRDRVRRQARAHAAAQNWPAVVDRFAALLTDMPNPPGRRPAAANAPL
jgi:glycosyltransferase involved in cell wall biosynthesis